MGLFFNRRCQTNARMDGKTAIITGSNTGIGKMTAIELVRRGAKVIMACRDVKKATAAADDIMKSLENSENCGQVVVMELDLSSLKSVRNCASAILQNEERIHLLINNAGVMMCPWSLTADGYEMHFGTNHLGHFLFTLLLLPTILASSPARIVTVSSLAHTLGTGVTVYCLHPGVVSTELTRHLDSAFLWGARWFYENLCRWFQKTPEEGAQTTLHCALDEQAGLESGLYYDDCQVAPTTKYAEDESLARELWDKSLELVEFPRDVNPFVPKN